MREVVVCLIPVLMIAMLESYSRFVEHPMMEWEYSWNRHLEHRNNSDRLTEGMKEQNGEVQWEHLFLNRNLTHTLQA